MPNWQLLISNVAVVTLFVLAWGYVRNMLGGLPDWQRGALFGALMGAGAVASMLLAVPVSPGVLIDLRGSFLALAGLFGGPLAALVAAILVGGTRLWLGGIGAPPALVGVALVSLAGTLAFLIRGKRPTGPLDVVVVAIAAAAATQLAIHLTVSSPQPVSYLAVEAGMALLNITATIIAGLVLLTLRRNAAERAILRTALLQAPDFLYVKDKQSRFVLANHTVSDHHGFASPSDMLGKTDFDLADPERAEKLVAAEQEVLHGTGTVRNFEEAVLDDAGRRRWYSTTKAALRNERGKPVGLVGITRDITDLKEMQEELHNSRKLLASAVAEMTDGVALFDASGTLLVCNDRYRMMFPRTGHLRLPGVNIRTILEAVVATGEQLNVYEDRQAWIREKASDMRTEGQLEVELCDGRWLSLQRRPMSFGGTMMVVSDVTETRLRSDELKAASEVLKQLASIDALTGLANRRILDEKIAEEAARSQRNGTPLSLLLIDVDHFKSFNDTYGHPAGDKCLQTIARCIREVLRRPADLAARYGGEEFAAVLPETDEDGAFQLGQAIRAQLLSQAIQHSGSAHRLVTVSIGAATTRAGTLDVAQLLARADEALYGAKAAGRNRINGWRAAQSGRTEDDRRTVG